MAKVDNMGKPLGAVFPQNDSSWQQTQPFVASKSKVKKPVSEANKRLPPVRGTSAKRAAPSKGKAW
jgi:hypothetical protein